MFCTWCKAKKQNLLSWVPLPNISLKFKRTSLKNFWSFSSKNGFWGKLVCSQLGQTDYSSIPKESSEWGICRLPGQSHCCRLYQYKWRSGCWETHRGEQATLSSHGDRDRRCVVCLILPASQWPFPQQSSTPNHFIPKDTSVCSKRRRSQVHRDGGTGKQVSSSRGFSEPFRCTWILCLQHCVPLKFLSHRVCFLCTCLLPRIHSQHLGNSQPSAIRTKQHDPGNQGERTNLNIQHFLKSLFNATV